MIFRMRKINFQFFFLPALYTRVWDVADYVVPPAENGAFFVATNVIITANQTRGRIQKKSIKGVIHLKPEG